MTEDIAECEFMYGGGFLGPVAGNCIINLGNGRIFNSFAGACNADIYGHTETYIGTNGFPYVRDLCMVVTTWVERSRAQPISPIVCAITVVMMPSVR